MLLHKSVVSPAETRRNFFNQRNFFFFFNISLSYHEVIGVDKLQVDSCVGSICEPCPGKDGP